MTRGRARGLAILFVLTIRWDRAYRGPNLHPLRESVGPVQRPEVDPYPALVAGDPPTVVHTYRGAQQADTAAAFWADTAELARYGYLPTTQSWAQGGVDRAGAPRFVNGVDS